MNIEYILHKNDLIKLKNNHEKIFDFCKKKTNEKIEFSYIEYIKHNNSNILYEEYSNNFCYKLSEDLFDDYTLTSHSCSESQQIDKFWNSKFQKEFYNEYLETCYLDNYRSILSLIRDVIDLDIETFKLSLYTELFRFLHIILNYDYDS